MDDVVRSTMAIVLASNRFTQDMAEANEGDRDSSGSEVCTGMTDVTKCALLT